MYGIRIYVKKSYTYIRPLIQGVYIYTLKSHRVITDLYDFTVSDHGYLYNSGKNNFLIATLLDHISVNGRKVRGQNKIYWQAFTKILLQDKIKAIKIINSMCHPIRDITIRNYVNKFNWL